MPYTLRWRFTTTRNDGTGGLSLHADGDFVGEGTWTFIPDGDDVKAFYDWPRTPNASDRRPARRSPG